MKDGTWGDSENFGENPEQFGFICEYDGCVHKYNDKTIKEPTYTENGIIVHTCIYCKENSYEYIPKLIRNGWVSSRKGWKYFKDDIALKGLFKIGDNRYYFGPDAVMKTGWQKIEDKWYYFASDGIMQTGWKKIKKKWYYFEEDGIMQTGWIKLEGKWYYLKSDGSMKKGWHKENGKWYYHNSSGVMLRSCSQKIGDKTYDFNKHGVCTNP